LPRRVHHQPQLGPLLVFRYEVALHHRGETALGTQRQVFDGQKVRGLVPSGFTSQTNFLLALARHTNFADLDDADATEHQKTAARLQFKTLIHPEGMGETFRVLAQRKGIEAMRLAGFEAL
jgi:hypothetical protein